MVFKNEFTVKELLRNEKIIVQRFLASEYSISPELMENFISYNDELGEKNFKYIIKNQSSELKEKGNIKCRSCGKTYNLNNCPVCPKCNSENKFDINDVIYKKEWC